MLLDVDSNDLDEKDDFDVKNDLSDSTKMAWMTETVRQTRTGHIVVLAICLYDFQTFYFGQPYIHWIYSEINKGKKKKRFF